MTTKDSQSNKSQNHDGSRSIPYGMKNLCYIANMRLPTERAHGIQIMKMCEAFAISGQKVELIVPKRRNPIKEDTFDYYQIKPLFKITRLWCLDTVFLGKIGYWVELVSFSIRLIFKIASRREYFYSRDEFIVFILYLFGKKVAWEAHMGQKNFFVRSLIKSGVPIVVISHGLKELYLSLGSRQGQILVSPDAVDLSRFDTGLTKEEAREKLEWPPHKKVAVYSGSQEAWKGTQTLKEAGELLSSEIEVKIITGKHHDEIPVYLKAADVLVIPNSGKSEISRLYTSPIKLFEYMASGTPIVASDLPSLREILNESCAYFFEPDNPQSLAEVMRLVFSQYDEAKQKARFSLGKVRQYSWHSRASEIDAFIERKNQQA